MVYLTGFEFMTFCSEDEHSNPTELRVLCNYIIALIYRRTSGLNDQLLLGRALSDLCYNSIMEWDNDSIIEWYDLARSEHISQKGMNFGINPQYSIILMSRRGNAPYNDYIYTDGVTIEYEGHDVPKDYNKEHSQEEYTGSGALTENGKFIRAIKEYEKTGIPEKVKVYEKIIPNRWSFKGLFDLVGYKIVNDGKRNVFRFILKLSDTNVDTLSDQSTSTRTLPHTRLIPSSVKQEVYVRDSGRCVLCGSTENLHFDHELPFSKGGTSLSADNIRILCQKCNLKKSNKIE